MEFSENPEMVFPVFLVVSISGNPITAIVFIESIWGNPFFGLFHNQNSHFSELKVNSLPGNGPIFSPSEGIDLYVSYCSAGVLIKKTFESTRGSRVGFEPEVNLKNSLFYHNLILYYKYQSN